MLSFSNFDVQCRVASLGFHPGEPGVYGAKTFDGVLGLKSKTAINACRHARGIKAITSTGHADLFHVSGLHRIVMHWSAGSYTVASDDEDHYHFVADQHGGWHSGDCLPERNATIGRGDYAAHTLGLNTGSIGVALDAMGLACESPFDCGEYPITEKQLERFTREIAYLAVTYDIPVHRVSILSHAEVQSTLGKPQRQKWDITWLPGMEKPGSALAVGDILRGRIRDQVEAIRAS